MRGLGYDVWRLSYQLTNAKKILERGAGCCGQFDIQSDGTNLVEGRQSNHRSPTIRWPVSFPGSTVNCISTRGAKCTIHHLLKAYLQAVLLSRVWRGSRAAMKLQECSFSLVPNPAGLRSNRSMNPSRLVSSKIVWPASSDRRETENHKSVVNNRWMAPWVSQNAYAVRSVSCHLNLHFVPHR